MSDYTLDQLISVAEFAKRHPQFSESKLRWWIYRSEPRKGATRSLPANGFSMCFRRTPESSEILLIEPKVLEWLLGDRTGEAAND